MFKKILVPLDRSALAEQALGTAGALARVSRGDIGLVLAHTPVAYEGSPAASRSGAKDPEAMAYVRRMADEMARGARLTVSGTVETGDPVDVICRRAREIGADLIVMTSHGRTGFSRAWLGSVTDGVVRRAAVPVLLLRATADTTALGHGAAAPLLHRILVPVDGSESAAAVLDAVASFAKCSNATVTLLRVVAPVPIYFVDPQVPAYATTIPDLEATQQVVAAVERELAELATNAEQTHDIKLETVVEVSGSTASAILDVAKSRGIDLIAMTTHGRGISRLVLGSVTDKVLRGGHLPMLLYHPGASTAAAERVPSPALAANEAIRRMSPRSEPEVTA